jgi:ubiquinone/menaquinone biosynthesis C-methylase UbiE
MTPLKNTQRFSDRVEDYVRYRPSYPAAALDALGELAGFNATTVVADIGSGTGIFAQLLLPHCARVYGVEPNEPMRAAGERLLGGNPKFSSVDGTAEMTNLADASVDLVTAAQAFHWFDVPACRREFSRILRPGGSVALIWNERLTDETPFLAEYERMLKRHAIDYRPATRTNIDLSALGTFYAPRGFSMREFPNQQCFDYPGLKGRLLSSSYAPGVGHPGHAPMIADLESLFAQHAEQGTVTFFYSTKVFVGKCCS